MKNSRLLIICMFLLMLMSTAMFAAGNGLAFLKIDVDARAAGMAGAYTALASDASSAYWNPAGLAGQTQSSLMLMHNAWLADISQEFAALQLHYGRHSFAFSANLLTIPGIEIRGEQPTNEPLGKTEAVNFYGALSYATVIGSQWQAGITAKYLYEKYYLEMAPGWAIDLGVQRRNILPGLDAGFAAQNLGQMTKLRNESTPLPMMFRAGAAYHVPYLVLENTPLVAMDVQYVRDEDLYYRFGVEQAIRSFLALRAGLVLGAETRWTAGLSINYNSFRFDYAYAPYQYDLGEGHRLSLGIRF